MLLRSVLTQSSSLADDNLGAKRVLTSPWMTNLEQLSYLSLIYKKLGIHS